VNELTTTAQNIREHAVRTFKEFEGTFKEFEARVGKPEWLSIGSIELQLMSAAFEIAAQLAEQNDQLRAERQQRKVFRDEDIAASKKRDEVMAGLAEASSATMANFSRPPAAPPRITYPNEVAHLGCIIREPDGALKIATNQGQLLELSEADFQRIFAPPAESEAKPQ
jgi:hypothetical protein